MENIWESKKNNGKKRNTGIGNGAKNLEQDICSTWGKDNVGQGSS
jgi:hypothetical protein